MSDAELVFTGLGLVPPLISLVLEDAKGLAGLSEKERNLLLRLRQEVRGNIQALDSSPYGRKLPLALATEDFYAFVGSLQADAMFEAYQEGFTAKKPPQSAAEKMELIRYTRYALIYCAEQIAAFKGLVAFKAASRLLQVRLKRRLDTFMQHLKALDKILAAVPVEPPLAGDEKGDGVTERNVQTGA